MAKVKKTVYYAVVYVRDTNEAPARLAGVFPSAKEAAMAAWEKLQVAKSAGWLIPKDLGQEYLRYIPFHAIDEVGIENETIEEGN